MTDLAEVQRDLLDEQQALDTLVAALTPEQWSAVTPSPGWNVTDQLGHLTYFDGAAALAVTNPAEF
ncbi:MAG: maleylpyruvate isomerase N-terminal domain-containing protein, partial [Actinobacteria bacterium]|nr:maleylpyruvate isomerase N-terminal domain-containing protein [Actinomycetota bacterium]